MSNNNPGDAPAGWYPVDDRTHRYWTGSEWSTQTRPSGPVPTQKSPATSPTPNPAPVARATTGESADPASPVSAGPPPKSSGSVTSWYRRGWVLAVVALLVGIGIGSAADSSADPKESAAYKSATRNLEATQAELAKSKEDLATAQADLKGIAGTLPQREATLKTNAATLDKRKTAVAAGEVALTRAKADVLKREKAVGIVEKEIQANSVSGDGIYKVGSDLQPGTYKTAGASGCYYAILNSTDTSDIADNNNIDGPAFVTVRSGQYLESSRCDDWVLQK
jgi:hypothetical protein